MKSVFLLAVLCCVAVSVLAHRRPMRPNSGRGHDDDDGDNDDEGQYFKLFQFMDDKNDGEYDGLFKRLVDMLNNDDESEDDEDKSDSGGIEEQGGDDDDDEESDSDEDKKHNDDSDQDHSSSPRKRFFNRFPRRKMFQEKRNYDEDEESDSDGDKEDDGGSDGDHSRSPRKRFFNRYPRKNMFQENDDDEDSHTSRDNDDDDNSDQSRSPRKRFFNKTPGKKIFQRKPILPFLKQRGRNSNSQINRSGPSYKRFPSPISGGKRFPKPGRFPSKILSNKRRSGYRPSPGQRITPKPMKKIYYKFRRSSTSKAFRLLMQMLKSKTQRKSRIFKIRSILMKMMKLVQNKRSKADQSRPNRPDSSRGMKNYLPKKNNTTGNRTEVITFIRKLLNTLQIKMGKGRNATNHSDRKKCVEQCAIEEKCHSKRNVTKMLQSAPKLCQLCVAKKCKNEMKRMCYFDAREKCKKVCPETFKEKVEEVEEGGTCKTCINECLDEDGNDEEDIDGEEVGDDEEGVDDEEDGDGEEDGDDEEDSNSEENNDSSPTTSSYWLI